MWITIVSHEWLIWNCLGIIMVIHVQRILSAQNIRHSGRTPRGGSEKQGQVDKAIKKDKDAKY